MHRGTRDRAVEASFRGTDRNRPARGTVPEGGWGFGTGNSTTPTHPTLPQRFRPPVRRMLGPPHEGGPAPLPEHPCASSSSKTTPRMAEALSRGLEGQGYAVDVAARGYEGEELAVAEPYDLIVLDIMLPDRDGLDVCRDLRRQGIATPILTLTSLSSTADKVGGLDAGADDYLTKPFDFEELLARVRALLRRGTASEASRLSYADLEIDLLERTVRRAGELIQISAKEFTMLEFFVRNPDRVLDRSTIAQKIWGLNYEPSSNVIEVYVSNLRRKLDRDFDPPLIHTVIGMGYRFGTPGDAS